MVVAGGSDAPAAPATRQETRITTLRRSDMAASISRARERTGGASQDRMSAWQVHRSETSDRPCLVFCPSRSDRSTIIRYAKLNNAHIGMFGAGGGSVSAATRAI